MPKKIVIVGGVAGGATAAARLRRLDENAQIVLLERGEDVSFANCGLPYYIGGVIHRRENLLVQSAAGLIKRFALDIRTRNEAIAIDRGRKTLTVRRLADGSTYEESYDALLLATGAEPVRPEIPGMAEAANLFTLRTIPDTDSIRTYIETNHARSAVVIGGGFIGLEMAENLRERGLSVTIVQHGAHVMHPFDLEMARILHRCLAENGVELVLNESVSAFENAGKSIVLGSGRKLITDLIVLAIGVRPESSLAKAAGLSLNARGGIVTNDRMQTSDPAIFAVGDAVEILQQADGSKAMIALAGPANKEARVAANVLCGKDDHYAGSFATSVLRLFHLTAASTGLNETALRAAGMPYRAIHAHPMDHAGYFPGASPLSLKLLYHPKTLAIYGAQAIGREGAFTRVDVIATAMAGHLKVTDLADLDLAYAPPYSSAKDPVNMLGFYAENLADGLDDSFQWYDVEKLVERKEFLLDVREQAEFELGAIVTAVNVPLSVLRSRLSQLPKDRRIYLYCQSGVRAHTALRILRANGFDATSLDGGYLTYRDATAPIEPPSPTADKPESQNSVPASPVETTVTVDACGLQCPGPIVELHRAMANLKTGDTLKISATDPGFLRDVNAWAAKTGNTLLGTSRETQSVSALLKKGGSAPAAATLAAPLADGTTIVVFSEDLDKAIAALIIATGAAAMGRKVSLFFTFWGLNILRRAEHVPANKNVIEKMFGWMMPRGPAKLPISKMNMLGIGSAMIKSIMARKHIDSLPALLRNAQSLGVKITACAMSMDVMGIRREELIDGVEIGGVASYLGDASGASHNLFI